MSETFPSQYLKFIECISGEYRFLYKAPRNATSNIIQDICSCKSCISINHQYLLDKSGDRLCNLMLKLSDSVEPKGLPRNISLVRCSQINSLPTVEIPTCSILGIDWNILLSDLDALFRDKKIPIDFIQRKLQTRSYMNSVNRAAMFGILFLSSETRSSLGLNGKIHQHQGTELFLRIGALILARISTHRYISYQEKRYKN